VETGPDERWMELINWYVEKLMINKAGAWTKIWARLHQGQYGSHTVFTLITEITNPSTHFGKSGSCLFVLITLHAL